MTHVPTPIYVAGASRNWMAVADLIRYIKRRVGERQVRITLDWTQTFEEARQHLEGAVPSRIAQLDFWAIDNAEFVVALVTPDEITTGMWVEIGYAIGKEKQVFAVITHTGTSEDEVIRFLQSAVFLHHPLVSVLWNRDELFMPHTGPCFEEEIPF